MPKTREADAKGEKGGKLIKKKKKETSLSRRGYKTSCSRKETSNLVKRDMKGSIILAVESKRTNLDISNLQIILSLGT